MENDQAPFSHTTKNLQAGVNEDALEAQTSLETIKEQQQNEGSLQSEPLVSFFSYQFKHFIRHFSMAKFPQVEIVVRKGIRILH